MKERLNDILAQIDKLGGDARSLVYKMPASEADIISVEKELKQQLPTEFRSVLATVSSHCEFSWFLPDDLELPYPLNQIFSGQLQWNIDTIVSLNEARESWISEVFSNPDDEYDKVWYDKLAFQEIGNGDYLAIGLSIEVYGKIVYLSHDEGEGHGYVMADSFPELLEKWIRVGCVGGEDWQWLPLCKDKLNGIDPCCENAIMLKQHLGLTD